jgi:predicted CXXCH cytochrome family protein
MAGPQRYTTKVRAKRIALQYFTRSHPFRRWKTILSIAVPALGALWLLVSAARDDQRIYNSGPVSTAHAMFETECRLCHGSGPPTPVTQASLATAASAAPAGFFLPVTDAACKTCHAGPDHNAKSDTPACGSCHVEHVGKAVLVQIADRHCVQCHGELTTKDGTPPEFHAKVPSLASHPEFAVGVRDERQTVARVRLDATPAPTDTTPIKLNHAKHLKANLKGIEELQKQQPGVAGLTKVKDGMQLSCAFCHTPDERGQYMQELSYEKHCAACHPLDFDGRFPDSVLPHTKPTIVRAFLRGTLAEAFEQCQAIPAGDAGKPIRDRCVELELAKAPPQPAAEGDRPRGMRRGGGAEAPAPPADEPRGGRLRGRAAEPEPDPAPAPDTPRGGRLRGRAEEEAPAGEAPRGRRGRAAEEAPAAPTSWVGAQFGTIEPGVFKQRCEYCHTVKREGGGPAEVVPPTIPARWLPHSRFDHGAHRPVACTECHAAAASTETKDVLMPKVETCRECHQPKVGARSGCVECHRYHDKSQERDPNGPFKVQQLRTHGSNLGADGQDRLR